MKILKDIAEFIRGKDHFLITSHARPDGDSLGTAFALAEALGQIGKTAEVVNADPVPRMYESLPGSDSMIVSDRIQSSYGALIVLECCNLERTGVKGLGGFATVNIDHHLKNDEFGDLNWVDPKAAAVGEMVFLLFGELGVRITPEIATNLYVALLTDTGSFHFSNTTAETFRIAGELVGAGADPAEIAQTVLMNQPESRLRLLCRVLNSLEFDLGRRVAWLALTQEMLETEESYKKLEGFGFSKSDVDRYIQGQQAFAGTFTNSVYEVAGGQEEYSSLVQWAAENVDSAVINDYNKALADLDQANATRHLEYMKLKYQQGAPKEARRLEGDSGGTGMQPFTDKNEWQKAATNRLYGKDAKYTQMVDKRYLASRRKGLI